MGQLKLRESNESKILYKIYNYTENEKAFTINISKVKSYLEEHIGDRIAIYQNEFKLISDKKVYNAFKDMMLSGFYDFPDIGKQLKAQTIGKENIGNILNTLIQCNNTSTDDLKYFDIKVIDEGKLDNGYLFYHNTDSFSQAWDYYWFYDVTFKTNNKDFSIIIALGKQIRRLKNIDEILISDILPKINNILNLNIKSKDVIKVIKKPLNESLDEAYTDFYGIHDINIDVEDFKKNSNKARHDLIFLLKYLHSKGSNDINKYFSLDIDGIGAKCWGVEDGDTLYWVTQSVKPNAKIKNLFKKALKDTHFKKVFLILRDDSCYDYEADVASGKGKFININESLNEYYANDNDEDEQQIQRIVGDIWSKGYSNISRSSIYELVNLLWDNISGSGYDSKMHGFDKKIQDIAEDMITNDLMDDWLDTLSDEYLPKGWQKLFESTDINELELEDETWDYDELEEARLTEGCWSCPDTVQKAKELANLINKPLPASEASDKLYHLLGDDDLFDSIADYENEEGPDYDVSFLVKGWIVNNILRSGDVEWNKEFDPKVINILKNALKKDPYYKNELTESDYADFEYEVNIPTKPKDQWEDLDWLEFNENYNYGEGKRYHAEGKDWYFNIYELKDGTWNLTVDYDTDEHPELDGVFSTLEKAQNRALEIYNGEWAGFDESLKEDTIKQNGKWVNKGKEGTHGTFKTKKQADAQRKAMFANGYREGLKEDWAEQDSDKLSNFNSNYFNNEHKKILLKIAKALANCNSRAEYFTELENLKYIDKDLYKEYKKLVNNGHSLASAASVISDKLYQQNESLKEDNSIYSKDRMKELKDSNISYYNSSSQPRYYNSIKKKNFIVRGMPQNKLELIYEDGSMEIKKEKYFKELLNKGIICRTGGKNESLKESPKYKDLVKVNDDTWKYKDKVTIGYNSKGKYYFVIEPENLNWMYSEKLNDLILSIDRELNESLKEARDYESEYNITPADKKKIIQWWKDIDNYYKNTGSKSYVSGIDEIDNTDDIDGWLDTMWDALLDLVDEKKDSNEALELLRRGKALFNKYSKYSYFNYGVKENKK